MRHYFPGRACVAKPVGIQFVDVRVGLYAGLDSSLFAFPGRNFVECAVAISDHIVCLYHIGNCIRVKELGELAKSLRWIFQLSL